MNGFSEVCKRYLLNSLSNHIEKILSNFIAAYRIENCKKHLDNKKIVGTVLMDLSNAFDCIPHDLLIANLLAYGFIKKALTFLYFYLKRRKQRVKINHLLSGAHQGSSLGPLKLPRLQIDNYNVERIP